MKGYRKLISSLAQGAPVIPGATGAARISVLRVTLAAAWALSLLALAVGTAHAQTARSGGGANAQLTQQMQQLASERTSLQAENARLKKELDDLRKERDTLKKAQTGLDERAKAAVSAALARGTSQREAQEQELKQTKDKMQELVGKFRETVQALREAETVRAGTKQTLATRDQELRVCVERNLALYKLNGEVLSQLEHPVSRLARAEPFTRIKRVQLENLVDDYKGRAADQLVKPVQPDKATP
jgi:chromosome segregation ATPase